MEVTQIKLNEFVNKQRDEIFARMKVPVEPNSLNSSSTDISNMNSIDQIPYRINRGIFWGSKSLFQADSKENSTNK